MKNYGGFMYGSPILKERIYKTNLEKYGNIQGIDGLLTGMIRHQKL